MAGKQKRRDVIESKVRSYVELAIDSSPEERPLTQDAVSKYVKCARQSLYNYGLVDLIENAAKKQAKNASSKKKPSVLVDYLERIKTLKEEVELWKGRYHTVLDKVITIEDNLRNEDIAVEELYSAGVATVDRKRNSAGSSKRINSNV